MKTRLPLLIALCAAPLASLADIRTDANGRRVDCHEETVTTTTDKEGHPIVGALIGGAAGAVAGHQFGKGRGKDAATAGGAVAGAAAGHELAKGGQKSETHTEERCVPID
jgi:uncharacterized protein YcfJ